MKVLTQLLSRSSFAYIATPASKLVFMVTIDIEQSIDCRAVAIISTALPYDASVQKISEAWA